MFALVGAAGAAIAPFAGHWADRGLVRPMTGIAFMVAAPAFALAGFGGHSVVLIASASAPVAGPARHRGRGARISASLSRWLMRCGHCAIALAHPGYGLTFDGRRLRELAGSHLRGGPADT